MQTGEVSELFLRQSCFDFLSFSFYFYMAGMIFSAVPLMVRFTISSSNFDPNIFGPLRCLLVFLEGMKDK